VRRVAFSPDDLQGDDRSFWEGWTSDAAEATDSMFEVHASGVSPKADDDDLWGRLKRWIAEHAFANKCAYCEGDISAHSPQHAEHWRPKGKVTKLDEDGNERVVIRGDERHPGYWWVAYDWRNLVPACDFCNTAGAKGTKFPIAGDYVFHPDEARDMSGLNRIEQPLLLHPYGPYDPREHIGFYRDGTAYARNKSPRGCWTIRVMDLNREALVNARQKRQKEALDAFGQAASDAVRFGIDLDSAMEGWSSEKAPYNTAVRDGLTAARDDVGEQLSGLF
jgi:hypothetical protein